MSPTVSIISLAYNHEKYIEQALDGFLSQITNFDIEIIIHDDASTDNTRKIIEKYQKSHPDIIKPVFQTENQYSKHDWIFINKLFESAKGKYIAICETDDYWTDVNKLQKQVDLMESRQELALCFHPVKVVHETNEKDSYVAPIIDNLERFTIEELVRENYIYTNSVMYRSRESYADLERFVMPQDLYMHLLHLKNGQIGIITDVMSVYRKQPTGVWWNSKNDMHSIYKQFNTMLMNFYAQTLLMFENDEMIKQLTYKHINHLLEGFIEIDLANKTELLNKVSLEFPSIMAKNYKELKSLYDELLTDRSRLDKDSKEALQEVRRLEKELQEESKKLDDIKQSRFYKMYTKLKHWRER